MTKTVMITGAGSGFGKGASIALAARGHTVIATTETEEQAKELRMRAFVTNDQIDPAEVVTRMVELTEADTTTENNFVPPDILGHVAGGS